jgi:hypothetical protein
MIKWYSDLCRVCLNLSSSSRYVFLLRVFGEIQSLQVKANSLIYAYQVWPDPAQGQCFLKKCCFFIAHALTFLQANSLFQLMMNGAKAFYAVATKKLLLASVKYLALLLRKRTMFIAAAISSQCPSNSKSLPAKD